MGVLHGDDIMFMFGEALKPAQNYSQEDRELSRMMMTYWTNFAKTGSDSTFHRYFFNTPVYLCILSLVII